MTCKSSHNNLLRWVILYAFIMQASYSHAQETDSALANHYYQKAQNTTQPDSFKHWMEQAAQLYEKTGAWGNHINCYNEIGNHLKREGHYDQALEYYQKTLDITIEKFGKENSNTATLHSNIAGIYSDKGNYEQALELYEKALSIRLKILDPTHPDIAESYNTLGITHWQKGHHDQALDYFHQSLAIKIQRYGTVHINIASSYHNIGTIYRTTGAYDQALEYYQKARSVMHKLPNPEPSYMAGIYNGIGIVYSDKGVPEQALHYYRKSLEIKLKIKGERHPDIALSYNNIGLIHANRGQYKDALHYYQQALSIWQETFGSQHPYVASAYNQIGLTHWYQGAYDTALEYLHQSLTIKLKITGEKHSSVADSYNNLGNVYKDKGAYEQALDYFHKALDIDSEITDETHPDIASRYLNMGVVYYRMRTYDEALGYLKKAANSLFKTVGEEHPDVIVAYTNMGNVYRSIGAYDKAHQYFRKVLKAYLKLYGKNHFRVAHTYHNIGTVYDSEQQYDLALEYYQKSLDINRKALGKTHPDIAHNYSALATVYRNKKEPEQARHYFEKALTISLQALGYKHPYVGRIYSDMASIYRENKDYETALTYYQKAIRALVNDFEEETIEENPELDYINDEGMLLLALAGKAMSLEQRYDQSNKQQDLTLSHTTYQLAIRLMDQIKKGYKTEKSEHLFAEEHHIIYHEAIQNGLKYHRVMQDKAALWRVFQFAEKSKAGTLREALDESQARRFAGIPDSLLEKEKNLKTDLSYYETELQKMQPNTSSSPEEKQDTNLIRDFEDRYFALKRAYENLIKNFEQNYPKYYQLKYDPEVATVKQVQQKLIKQKSMLIEYVVADSTIYIFSMNKKHIRINSILKPGDFEQTLTAFRKNLSNYRHFMTKPEEARKSYVEQARKLYKLLLAPILDNANEHTEELIIVPDGLLAYLPFETLLEQATEHNSENYRSLPYLIKKYRIRYAYSATLLLHNKQVARTSDNGQCLAFTPDDTPAGNTIAQGEFNRLRSIGGALPGTQQEVKAIAKHFKGRFYFGLRATEQHFKEEAGQYRLIHLAMHGLADQERPLYSKLAFNETGDTIEDGLLHTYELYNMQLNAELVVLSACETGYGKNVKGEGIMSMARGFMYAGSPSVVYTLWKVDDRASSRLMEHFYTFLAKGMEKDKALQQARIHYLKEAQGKEAHPFYWSGFVLAGAADALPKKRSRWYWWMASIAAVLTLWLFYKKFIKNN